MSIIGIGLWIGVHLVRQLIFTLGNRALLVLFWLQAVSPLLED